MLGVCNEILAGLQHVRDITHRWWVLDLFLKNPTGFDWPFPTGKADCSQSQHDEGAGFGLW